MAITITTVNPPAVATPLAIDWQAAQSADPMAEQPIATLAAGLATGTVNARGTSSNPPLYTASGVNGLTKPGGDQANGVMAAKYLVVGTPLAVVDGGTSGATNKTGQATTGGAPGTGMTVDLVAAGGVVTSARVGSNPGNGQYPIGAQITVAAATAGTAADVVLRVA
jgi:hypothetical protein